MQILKESFTISIERQKMILKNKITSLKYNTELDINMFITDLQNKISQYEKIDTNMSNSTKVGILNRSLPENIRWINVFQYVDNWKQCCQYVKKVIPEIVFSNFKEQNILNTINDNNNILLTQNNNKNYKKKQNKNTKTKLYKKRRNGKCYHCGKKGHYYYECKFKNNNKKRISSKKHFRNNNKYKNYHSNKNFDKNNNKKYIDLTEKKENYDPTYSDIFSKDYSSEHSIEANFTSIISDNLESNNNISQWILDYGASINVTNNIRLLSNLRDCQETIFLADGKSLTAKQIGDMSGFINNHHIHLQKVYLVPKLNRNFISINELIKNNCKIIFNNNNNKLQAIIYNNKGTRIITITSNTYNNFKIWITTNKYNFNKINNQKQLNIYNIYTSPNLILWHRR